MASRPRLLEPFIAHGVEFTGERGDERYGTCPFTGKAEKFYVNVKTGLWDSKTAGISGNVYQFLRHMAKLYTSQITETLLQRLADDRSLPLIAFAGWEIGWDGSHYTIPVRSFGGDVIDIRRYRPGINVMSTKGCHNGLLGAHSLAEHRALDVYLYEGEWDCIAAQYLMKKAGKEGVCVAVPGAGIFKDEWVPWMCARVIHTHFDKDEAGDLGEQKVAGKLKGIARAVTYVHWPDELPDGFDVRDWVVYGLNKKTPKRSWQRLVNLYESRPRNNTKATAAAQHDVLRLTKTRAGNLSPTWKVAPTLEDVHRVFRKWLYLDNTHGIDVMLSVLLSQRIEGPPVWMFMVGPPGSAKTEMVTALSELEMIYPTSTVTPHALISGANFQGTRSDPSLIPRLDGKVLVIKDFTAVMGMREQEKEEIFSILRDAYDGNCGKIFGNGVERSYTSRFTVIAAVTPLIYDLGYRHAQLGERFLKFSMADNLHHPDEYAIIRRAIDNTDRETKMRREIKTVVSEFVTRTLKDAPTVRIPELWKNKIIWLGRFGARMRGTVSRDTFRPEMMTSRPTAEVGSRLGIQLAKLCRALAMLAQRTEVAEADYLVVKKVMLDTVMQRTEDVLRCLHTKCKRPDAFMATNDIAAATRYPRETVTRLLQDLHVLDIVTKKSSSNYKHQWTLSPYIRECIVNAQLYQSPLETAPKLRLVPAHRFHGQR